MYKSCYTPVCLSVIFTKVLYTQYVSPSYMYAQSVLFTNVCPSYTQVFYLPICLSVRYIKMLYTQPCLSVTFQKNDLYTTMFVCRWRKKCFIHHYVCPPFSTRCFDHQHICPLLKKEFLTPPCLSAIFT